MNHPPKLAFACSAPWETMSGTERVRYCTGCRRSIPNLSIMTAAERSALAEKSRGERVCASFYVRLTGEMVTAERPLTAPEKNRVRQFGLAALSAGCVAPQTQSTPATAVAPVGVPTDKPAAVSSDDEDVVLLMGFVVAQDPPIEVRGPASKR